METEGTRNVKARFAALETAIREDNRADEEYDRLHAELKELYIPPAPGERGLGTLQDDSAEGQAERDRRMEAADQIDKRCDETERALDEAHQALDQSVLYGLDTDWSATDEDNWSLLELLLFRKESYPERLDALLNWLRLTGAVTQADIDEAHEEIRQGD
jgi:hypothetical protein